MQRCCSPHDEGVLAVSSTSSGRQLRKPDDHTCWGGETVPSTDDLEGLGLGSNSVLGDSLKTSVAMSSAASPLVFCRFLGANSELHLQAYFLASSTRDQLRVLTISDRSCIIVLFIHSSVAMRSCHINSRVFRMQRRWNTPQSTLNGVWCTVILWKSLILHNFIW